MVTRLFSVLFYHHFSFLAISLVMSGLVCGDAFSEPNRLDYNDSRIMAADEDEIELGWYLRILRRQWKLAVAGALIGGAAGFGFASSQPLRYEAVTTIFIPANNPQFSSATFRGFAENASLASQIISELKLGDGEHALTPSRFVEDVLRVEAVPGTSLVRVKVMLRDARTAAEASRSLAAKAIALARQVAPEIGTSIEDQLSVRLSDAQQDLVNAQLELMAFNQGAHAGLFRQDTAVELRQAEFLHLLLEIEGEDARLASAQAAIKEQPQFLTRQRLPAADAPAKTAGHEDGQPNDGGRDNPPANPVYETLDVQRTAARERLAALDKQVDKLVSANRTSRKDLATLRDLFRPQIERARLQARLDIARKVRDDLGVRYEQVRAQPSTVTRHLAVIDAAQPPDRPVSRRRLRHTTYGAAAGLVLSVVLVPLWNNRGRLS